jgi:fused signal recognition particle receptor
MALNWFKKKKEPAQGNDAPEPSDGRPERSPSTREDTDASDRNRPAPAEHPQPTSPDGHGDMAATDASAPQAGPPATAQAVKKGPGLFSRLKSGLSKTRAILTTDIDDLFLGKKLVDDDMLEVLEERLITADMGVATTMEIMARISGKRSRITGAKALKQALQAEILTYFDSAAPAGVADAVKPQVVMVVGVNGVGKTTTIGKLAAHEAAQGKKVLIAAADTFRAAAIEQIAIWAERAGADIVRHKDHADPAAVAYDSIDAAVSRGVDTVFVDTAGRLHTKVNLMEEIKKVQRTLAKRMPGAPHEVLLVLDATTGQNALSQARMFDEALGVTGIALTKLDGTAKGGIVVSICSELDVPLKYIGVGEGVADLQVFDPEQFVAALF